MCKQSISNIVECNVAFEPINMYVCMYVCMYMTLESKAKTSC